jgi:hypothetical protein
MELTDWSRKVSDLARALATIEQEAAALGLPPIESSAWHANLHQKLIPQLGDDPYLIVAVTGGTNIGKSTVFNHLVGFAASRAHPDATQTKHPVGMLPRGFESRHTLDRAFPDFTLKAWTTEDDALVDGPADLLIHREDPSGTQPANLVLLDTPDVDGALMANWERARRICHAADVLVAVLTDQKYNDAAVRRFFREAADADKTLLVVFNMVDWPDDRAHCPRWLETFRAGTGAAPAHVYAAPRDRQAARENRLTFHPLSEGSTDPRRDLSELHFDEIKLRSLRGATRQMLDPADGIPAFLDQVAARSAEYAKARDTVKEVVEQQFDAPELPAHVIIDEIWRWLEPRRTRFDRAVHRTYGHLTSGVRKAWGTAGKVVPWLPWAGDGEAVERDFLTAERIMLESALGEIHRKLDQVMALNPILARELASSLTGEERRGAYDELVRRHEQMPLLTDHYRQAVAERMDRFAAENPGMVKAIRWGLVATAVIRPAITIGAFGASEVAIHALVHQGGHHLIQIGVDALAGVAVTAGVDRGAGLAQRTSLERLLKGLIEDFYRERIENLRGVIHDCALGRHLERIDHLAGVAEQADYLESRRLVNELRKDLLT